MPLLNLFIRVNFEVGVKSVKVVIRDNHELLLGVAYFWKSYVLTPLVVEAWACREAIRFVKEMGFRKVEFESDFLLLITKINLLSQINLTSKF